VVMFTGLSLSMELQQEEELFELMERYDHHP
jgi:hypothetical protein